MLSVAAEILSGALPRLPIMQDSTTEEIVKASRTTSVAKFQSAPDASTLSPSGTFGKIKDGTHPMLTVDAPPLTRAPIGQKTLLNLKHTVEKSSNLEMIAQH